MSQGSVNELIQNLGFPIVCCCALFWQNAKQDEKYTATIDKLRDVIAENTLVLKELSEKLRKE